MRFDSQCRGHPDCALHSNFLPLGGASFVIGRILLCGCLTPSRCSKSHRLLAQEHRSSLSLVQTNTLPPRLSSRPPSRPAASIYSRPTHTAVRSHRLRHTAFCHITRLSCSRLNIRRSLHIGRWPRNTHRRACIRTHMCMHMRTHAVRTHTCIAPSHPRTHAPTHMGAQEFLNTCAKLREKKESAKCRAENADSESERARLSKVKKDLKPLDVPRMRMESFVSPFPPPLANSPNIYFFNFNKAAARTSTTRPPLHTALCSLVHRSKW